MSEKIINGISRVDRNEHVVTGRYRIRNSDEDPSEIEVIEVTNSRLLHTRIEGGHPDGRIAVFSRFITQQELESRATDFQLDANKFNTRHIQDLAN